LGCAEIDSVGYRNEANGAACELAQATQRLGSIASQTIQASHDDRINVGLPGFEQRCHASTTRTISQRTGPGNTPVLDDLHKLSVSYLAPRFDAAKLRRKTHAIDRLLLGGTPRVGDDPQEYPK